MAASSDTRILKYRKSDISASLWPFTPLDRNLFRLIIRGTWIFREMLDPERLADGFETLLGFYPHLAGRIDWKTGVRLNNSGIPFTVAHMPGRSIEQITADNTLTDICSEPLDKRKMKSGAAACISVKITRIDEGTVIGVRCLHSLLDGAGFYGMVRDWASCCRGKPVEPPVLDQMLFPRSNPLPAKKDLLEKALQQGCVRITPKSMISLLMMSIHGSRFVSSPAFHFPTDKLRALRKRISIEAGFDCGTNEALSAFIIRKCIALNRHEHTSTPYWAQHVVDSRGRVSSLPPRFAGNAALALTTAAFFADTSEGVIAKAIHDTLSPRLTSPSPELTEFMTMLIDITTLKLPILTFDFEKSFRKIPTAVYINNFNRLPVYDVDFGHGTPAAVIPHDLADPVKFWPAPPEKGGIEVYFGGSFARTIRKLNPDDPWFNFSV